MDARSTTRSNANTLVRTVCLSNLALRSRGLRIVLVGASFTCSTLSFLVRLLLLGSRCVSSLLHIWPRNLHFRFLFTMRSQINLPIIRRPIYLTIRHFPRSVSLHGSLIITRLPTFITLRSRPLITSSSLFLRHSSRSSIRSLLLRTRHCRLLLL